MYSYWILFYFFCNITVTNSFSFFCILQISHLIFTFACDLIFICASGVKGNLEKMVSNCAEDVKICGSGEVECPETTVEIKIKTLDSETYTLRVDKCVNISCFYVQFLTYKGYATYQTGEAIKT